VCKSKKQLASADTYNVYKLWDRTSTMGCECDAGYGGPDCSERSCKSGIDPLYFDDVATVKHATYNFAVLTTAPTQDFYDGHAQSGIGHYAIRFYDTQGEDWVTRPIPATADCEEIVAALEAIPNNVIPPNTAICRQETEENLAEDAWDDVQANKGSVNDIHVTNHYPLGASIAQQKIDAHILHVGGAHNEGERTSKKMNFWEASTWLSEVDPGNLFSDSGDIANNGNGFAGSVDVKQTDPTFGVGPHMRTHPEDGTFDQSISNNLNVSSNVANTPLSGRISRILFTGNPGAIKQPEILIYLDGKRPSLSSHGKLITKVWTDGQQGENNDYFGDHCDGVTVRLNRQNLNYGGLTNEWDKFGYFLGGMTPKEISLFKKCLGASDFDTSNNVDVQNWDHGNMYYPHIVKLVRTVTSHNDGGYYAVVWFDSDTTWATPEGTFRLVNPIHQTNENWNGPNSDHMEDPLNPGVHAVDGGSDDYEVYTTRGTLALTSNYSQAFFGLGTNNIYTAAPEYDFGWDEGGARKLQGVTTVGDGDNDRQADGSQAHNAFPYDGDISCEVGQHNAYKLKFIFHCLNKSDIFTVLNWQQPRENPPHINLFTASRLYTAPADWSVGDKIQANFFEPNENFFAYQHWSEIPNGKNPRPGTTPGDSSLDPNIRNDPSPARGRKLHGQKNDAMAYMTHVVNTDISTNWAASSTVDRPGYPFYVYKFFPAKASTYNYVNECSNRGLCQRDTGLCECFPGYTNDDCSVQDSIAF